MSTTSTLTTTSIPSTSIRVKEELEITTKAEDEFHDPSASPQRKKRKYVERKVEAKLEIEAAVNVEAAVKVETQVKREDSKGKGKAKEMIAGPSASISLPEAGRSKIAKAVPEADCCGDHSAKAVKANKVLTKGKDTAKRTRR